VGQHFSILLRLSKNPKSAILEPGFACKLLFLLHTISSKKSQYESSKSEIKELIKTFRERGYKHGTAYLENLSERLFTNIELWLKTGIIAPKTISLLERVFREIGRRLKRIAWGWADKTVTNISKMIMIRQYSREKWEQYWKEKLGIKGYFNIEILAVKMSPCKHF